MGGGGARNVFIQEKESTTNIPKINKITDDISLFYVETRPSLFLGTCANDTPPDRCIQLIGNRSIRLRVKRRVTFVVGVVCSTPGLSERPLRRRVSNQTVKSVYIRKESKRGRENFSLLKVRGVWFPWNSLPDVDVPPSKKPCRKTLDTYKLRQSLPLTQETYFTMCLHTHLGTLVSVYNPSIS